MGGVARGGDGMFGGRMMLRRAMLNWMLSAMGVSRTMFGRAMVFGAVRGGGRRVHFSGDSDRLARQALDVAEIRSFFRVAEADGVSAGAGASGPSDAVDILLGNVGNVVVDHVRDV